MKLNSLLSILAVVPALLLSLPATSQAVPERSKTERAEPVYKWEAYAGYGYTSLNQIDQSRHGLQGVNFSLTRDFGKYFGLTGDGGFYSVPTSCCNPGDPYTNGIPAADGHPTVDVALAGPVLHANLYEAVDIFIHALAGVEHTGGASLIPDWSFAWGGGGGLEYKLKPRFSIRVSGDDIAASFVADPNHQRLSPHLHANPRATIGIVYRF